MCKAKNIKVYFVYAKKKLGYNVHACFLKKSTRKHIFYAACSHVLIDILFIAHSL